MIWDFEARFFFLGGGAGLNLCWDPAIKILILGLVSSMLYALGSVPAGAS